MKLSRRDMIKAAAAGIVLPQMLAGTGNVWGQQSGGDSKKSYALHIGVDEIDSQAYPGTPNLSGCVRDAKSYLSITSQQGFTKRKLLTNRDATVFNVSKYIHWAAIDLRPGDLFVVTYSGHGSQLRNYVAEQQEEDQKDETWCLHDHQLRDDRKYWLYAHFQEGVRILEISDSCHSGTVSRVLLAKEGLRDDLSERSSKTRAILSSDLRNRSFSEAQTQELEDFSARGPSMTMTRGDDGALAIGDAQLRARTLMQQEAQRAEDAFRADYEKAAGDFGDLLSQKPVAASGLLLAACQDTQLSWESNGGGLFTNALQKTLSDAPTGYQDFLQKIAARMPDYQRPNFFPFGQPDDRFYLNQSPFTV